MKNQKTFLLLSVIVAVLVLGVVYAAITADFTITTTAQVAPDSSNFKVVFSKAEVTSAANAKDTVVTAINNDAQGQKRAATLTIPAGVLKTVGDTVVATYTVSNTSSDLIANLGALTPSNVTGSEYVTFEAEYGTNGATVAKENGTTTVVVTATLIKQPIDDVSAGATFTFTATAEEA